MNTRLNKSMDENNITFYGHLTRSALFQVLLSSLPLCCLKASTLIPTFVFPSPIQSKVLHLPSTPASDLIRNTAKI